MDILAKVAALRLEIKTLSTATKRLKVLQSVYSHTGNIPSYNNPKEVLQKEQDLVDDLLFKASYTQMEINTYLNQRSA